MSVIVSDNRTLVVGLGQTGLSCVRFLQAQGRSVAVADTRQNPPALEEVRKNWPDMPVYLGPLDGELLSGFNELVVSPGVSIAEPAIQEAIEHDVQVRGDIDLFSQAATAPIVAITGSNGKTTVTTLLGEMAAAAGLTVAVGGNIGTPALELLCDDVELYVLELSSFQLETTEHLGAHAATILNVTDDHMDRYPSRMAYFQAKQRIFNAASKAVVNLDDPLTTPMARDNLEFLCYGWNRINLETFSTRDDGDDIWITWGLDNLIRASELGLMGRHNISNVMAALGLGLCSGLPMPAMLEVARQFQGLPHRCQFVRAVNGVDYINDSKGTNVGASAAAIASLAPGGSGKLILIAGGEGKGADFSPLTGPVKGHCRDVILIGRDAPVLEKALAGCAPLHVAADLADAVTQAAMLSEPGDRVLLSPACASFDMFRDYQDRGEQFMTLVGGLQ